MPKLDGLSIIEKKLLDRELKELKHELQRIGGLLIDAFGKYPAITGQHKEELREYLVSNIVTANLSYTSGVTVTQPCINTHSDHVPEALQKVILEYATADLLNKIDEIGEIAFNTEQVIRHS